MYLGRVELRRVAVLAVLVAGGCWFDLGDVVTETSSSSSSSTSVTTSGQGGEVSTGGAGGSPGGGGPGGAGGQGMGGQTDGGGGEGGARPLGDFVDCLATLDYTGGCFGDPSQAIYVYSDEAYNDGTCENLTATDNCVIHLCDSTCGDDPLCVGFACETKVSFEICQNYPAGWSACFGNVAFRRTGASQCSFNDCTSAGGYCHEDPAECLPFPP